MLLQQARSSPAHYLTIRLCCWGSLAPVRSLWWVERGRCCNTGWNSWRTPPVDQTSGRPWKHPSKWWCRSPERRGQPENKGWGAGAGVPADVGWCALCLIIDVGGGEGASRSQPAASWATSELQRRQGKPQDGCGAGGTSAGLMSLGHKLGDLSLPGRVVRVRVWGDPWHDPWWSVQLHQQKHGTASQWC